MNEKRKFKKNRKIKTFANMFKKALTVNLEVVLSKVQHAMDKGESHVIIKEKDIIIYEKNIAYLKSKKYEIKNDVFVSHYEPLAVEIDWKKLQSEFMAQ